MDFRGLVGGAANVSRGYRETETNLRAAEQERLSLQQLRMEQAARERADEARRNRVRELEGVGAPFPTYAPGTPVPQGVTPPQLPAGMRLGVRDVRPPVPPADPQAYGTWDVPGRVAEPTPETYVGPAPAPVTPLRQEAPVDQRLLDNSNQMVRIASMRVRDAEMGLQSLRDRGAGAAQIARAEGVLRNAQERLTAAQQGLQRVQTSGPQPAAQPAATPATPATPAAPTAATDALVKAMTQVESSGRPGAVSPSGAVGLMQVRPSTAMNPGYGVPNIFDFLRYEGTRNEAIATEFLKDPQTGAAYGRAYMDAMLREFGGNLDHALAAYNMGPGAAKKWVAEGADPAKLNRETREYIPKVRAELGQAAPTTAAQPAAQPAAETPPADAGPVATALRPGVTPEKVDFQMYAVEPGRLTVDQRYLRQDYERQRQMITDTVVGQITDLDGAYQAQRQGLVAEFNAQLGAKQSAEAQAARDRIVDLDDRYRVARRQLETQLQTEAFELDTKFRNAQLSLTSLAAAAQIEYQNDPTLASQVLSYAFGQPIRAQFRSDGNIDMLLPDRKGDFQVRQTFSKQDFIVMLRDAADQAYRAARQQLAQAQALKVSEEQARMIREVAVARIQAGAKLQEITLQGRQYKLTPDGTGNVFLLRGDGSQAGIIRPGGGKIPGPGGAEIEAPPTIQWVSSMR